MVGIVQLLSKQQNNGRDWEELENVSNALSDKDFLFRELEYEVACMSIAQSFRHSKKMGNVYVVWWWILAFVLLIMSGISYRVLAFKYNLIVSEPIELPIPLSSFPMEVDEWAGKVIPIPENIQRIAGNDDFINRLYVNKLNKEWVNLYVAYTGRPRNMLGHRPEICYVGGGWIHDSTERSSFVTASGRQTECLMLRFHTPPPRNSVMVVLNYYILNGQIICSEKGFSGVGFRAPNISGDPAKYVAQVQISSVSESSTRKAAEIMTDLTLEFLPDKNGKVGATELQDIESSILK